MFKQYNAEEVLKRVNNHLDGLDGYGHCHPESVRGYRIDKHANELSIFDWWNDYLSKSKLEDMRKFLKFAIDNDYKGYVCFKVGAKGCANGMWAHKEESSNGYSPDGEFLYKSFTPSYNCWALKAADGEIYPKNDDWDSVKTLKQAQKLIDKHRVQ